TTPIDALARSAIDSAVTAIASICHRVDADATAILQPRGTDTGPVLARLASGARIVAMTAIAITCLHIYACAVAASLIRTAFDTAVAAIRCSIDRHAFVALQRSIRAATLARSTDVSASTAVLLHIEAYAGSAPV